MAKFFLLPLTLLVAISMVESSSVIVPEMELLTSCYGENFPSAAPMGKIELTGLDGSETCHFALVTYSPYGNIKVVCGIGSLQLKTAAGEDYQDLVDAGSYAYSVDNRVYFEVTPDLDSGNIDCFWEAY